VIDFAGYSQSSSQDLQCSLSVSRGVVCSARFNEQGQLGQGYAGLPVGSVAVKGLPQSVSKISVFGNTGCALTSAGEVWCWGRWSSSRTGQSLLLPVQQMTGAKDLAGKCVIRWDDTVTCLATDLAVFRWDSNPAFPTALSIDESGENICAVTTARTVACTSKISVGFSTVSGLSDVAQIDYRNSHSCALLLDGTVTCYGSNEFGQLGDGTFMVRRSVVRLPEAAVRLATSDEVSGTTYRSCAIGVSATVYCWGKMIQAMGTSTIPRPVVGMGAWTAQAEEAPTKVTGLSTVRRQTNSVTVQWSPTSRQASPLNSYVLEWRPVAGDWTRATLSSGTTSWTSPYIPSDTALEIRVMATSAAGEGQFSDILATSTTQPPARMAAPEPEARSNTSVGISWAPAADQDEPITGYRIEWTTDRVNWQSRDVTAAEYSATISNLGAGTAIDIRIRALNAAGVGVASRTLTMFTTGLSSHTIHVEDSWGQAAYGGQITWRRPDNTYESAVDYGLTFEGSATFPFIPAGPVDVSLRGVQLAGGAIVDYDTETTIGYSSGSVITLPPEPSQSQHVVRVTMANGLPVVGATVVASGLYNVAEVDGARFVTPEVVIFGITNEFGEVYLTGYSDARADVIVEYDDGILIQRAFASLGRRDLDIVMEDMPWIETPVVSSESAAGSLVTLTMSTESAGANRDGSPRLAAGATISIDPPKGSTQKCAGKKLSATVGTDGTATLKVCATKSGRYVLRGKGVVSTGAVTLRVKGTAPLPVANARAFSPSHGVVTVIWGAPTYAGGAPIGSYTVTLKRGSKTITKTVTGTSVTINKLPGTTKWTVTVTAKSKSGVSEPVKMLVPVS
jgi:hypothetical protein